jgi:hypothetical protein
MVMAEICKVSFKLSQYNFLDVAFRVSKNGLKPKS